ncbi:TIGR02186 family protein [Ancylobacter sp. IITR112]|uniref:TIGR02186 family protein n=1 Tax=Ancylobacter sp. IITR112 TaxID=3138073 RepID=UPI00352A7B58
MSGRGALLLLALLALAGPPARAAELVLSLSKARVTITSNFTGDTLVLFGVIDPGTAEPSAPTDVVVTVRGPSESFTTWRKERRFGIWVNVDSRSFLAAPSYLAVLASRPPALIADAETLRREQAGLDNNHLLQRIGSDYADVVREDPFRQAFLRVKQTQGLYFERPAGVDFIAPNVFRATIPIPGTAPIGAYEVEVKTFADGALTGRGVLPLEVAKVDFEQTVATTAQDYPWVYGLATALMALSVGFIANLAFRKD